MHYTKYVQSNMVSELRYNCYNSIKLYRSMFTNLSSRNMNLLSVIVKLIIGSATVNIVDTNLILNSMIWCLEFELILESPLQLFSRNMTNCIALIVIDNYTVGSGSRQFTIKKVLYLSGILPCNICNRCIMYTLNSHVLRISRRLISVLM